MSSFWLQVSQPGHAGRVVPVPEKLVVGRDADGLLLDDATVSRRHLYVEPVQGALLCVDMGSANGTFVEGARLTEPRLLHAGDEIQLGETTLVVHDGRDSVPGDADADTTASATAPEHTERPSAAIRSLSRAAARGTGVTR